MIASRVLFKSLMCRSDCSLVARIRSSACLTVAAIRSSDCSLVAATNDASALLTAMCSSRILSSATMAGAPATITATQAPTICSSDMEVFRGWGQVLEPLRRRLDPGLADEFEPREAEFRVHGDDPPGPTVAGPGNDIADPDRFRHGHIALRSRCSADRWIANTACVLRPASRAMDRTVSCALPSSPKWRRSTSACQGGSVSSPDRSCSKFLARESLTSWED